MRVVRAKSAGFCFGVSLALKKLEAALVERESLALQLTDLSGLEKLPMLADGRITTLGPIIHNPLLVKEYEERGVVCLNSPHDARPGDIVVVRAHGVPKAEEAILRQQGCVIIDATCPKVKRAQLSIKDCCEYSANMLLLFGEPEHPELRGLVSYSGCGCKIFSSLPELRKCIEEIEPWVKNTLVHDAKACCLLAAQTTQSKDVFVEAQKIFVETITSLSNGVPLDGRLLVLDTICDATRKRQEELLALTEQVKAIIIVGGKNSGNTRRLAELAENVGVFSLHIEQPEELPLDELRRFDLIGLTAGASTPAKHIEAVECLLMSL